MQSDASPCELAHNSLRVAGFRPPDSLSLAGARPSSLVQFGPDLFVSDASRTAPFSAPEGTNTGTFFLSERRSRGVGLLIGLVFILSLFPSVPVAFSFSASICLGSNVGGAGKDSIAVV
jgi:hypothetical protein